MFYFLFSIVAFCFFFFFQAEDGIRDLTVTGVQTCALPIWVTSSPSTCADSSPSWRILRSRASRKKTYHDMTKEVRSMSQSSRPVAQVVTPEPVVEGAGVHLRRSIGTRKLDHLDPFLLLDHFESVNPADYEAGFPHHPHRGIETVTLVRKGEGRHRASLGHRGTIGAGDIQWMTSGSGILHEEMPQRRPEGIAGLQLWLNLPAREKMSPPKYRDLEASRLTETAAEGGARVRVIAGEAGGGRRAGPGQRPAGAPEVSCGPQRCAHTFEQPGPRAACRFRTGD